MSRKKPDLIRMALIYAIREREGYADADPGPHGQSAKELAAEFRAYFAERYEPQGFTIDDRLDRMQSEGKIQLVRLEDIPTD